MTYRPDGQQRPPRSSTSLATTALSPGLLAALLLATTGCTAPTASVGWWAYPDDDVRLDGAVASAVSSGSRFAVSTLELSAALNEVVGFRLEVASTGGDLSAVDIRATPLRGTDTIIPAEAVTLYRMHGVTVTRWPGWHVRSISPSQRDAHPDDVLVPQHAPVGGFPTVLVSGQAVPLWVDIAVPQSATPGTYTGAIQLLRADEVVAQLLVRLVVWPLELPDQAALAVAVDLDLAALFAHHVRLNGRPHVPGPTWLDDPARGELDAVLDATLRLLRRHRLDVLPLDLAPVAAVNASGGFDFNWQQFDAVLGPLMDGSASPSRTPARICRVPFSDRFPVAAAPQSPSYASAAAAYVHGAMAHFRQRDWADRAFVALPVGDSVPPQDASRLTEGFGRLSRQGDATTLSGWFPQDMAPYGWEGFAPLRAEAWVDIWAPRAQFFDAGVMRMERLDGRETWMRLDRPPFSGSLSVAARREDVRAIPWVARRLGAQAVLARSANSWPPPVGSASPQVCVEFDPDVLMYPGTAFGLNAPVPSMRLKWLRRGIQDAALMDVLARRGLAHVADALTASLVPHAGTAAYDTNLADGREIGWPADPQAWGAARTIMAEEVMRATDRRSSTEITDRDVQWRRFMEHTRGLTLTCEGVRVRPSGLADTGRMTVELRLTIESRERTAVGGSLRSPELPLGWSAREPAVEVEPLQPGTRRRASIVLDASVMTGTRDGVVSIPITLETPDSAAIRADARIAYVTTQWLDNPLRVDGDLSDWPDGIANVAGGFTLIHDGRTPAPDATLAFVARDETFLYVAVTCREAVRGIGSAPGAAPAFDGRRSDLTYDDLVPVGGDRIELVFDPLNAGTRSPADLFHVAVFRHGATRAEQGLELHPPVGRREPWNADVAAATRDTVDGWVAEVRIPLSAFPAGPSSRSVWGFNVLRWQSSEQLLSTWSGARRNAYDPLSLGNLRLP